jgi:hypothetical protein
VLCIGTETALGDNIIATINSGEELLDVAKHDPAYLRQMIIQFMITLRTCAYPLEYSETAVLREKYKEEVARLNSLVETAITREAYDN